MYLRKFDGPRVVPLPDGKTLSLGDLPDPKTRRWVASRKALVVLAVRHGLLHADEARRRYRLSPEELQSWMAAGTGPDLEGLKAGRAQSRRPA